MRITLTGAAGRLGRGTWQHLLDAGHEVTATDRHWDSSLPGRPLIANLLDREACYSLFPDTEVLVHLGNHPNHNVRDPQTLYAENCAMNVNLFHAAFESGVRCIIYASSIQVYGSGDAQGLPQYLPMDSALPLQPQNTYAESKVAAESLLRYYVGQGVASGTAFRFPYLLDEDRYRCKPEQYRFWGRRSEAFTFLTLSEAARLINLAVERSLPGFRARLVANASPINSRAIAELLREEYADVPLRRPLEQIVSLVEQETIFEEFGWKSDPIPC